MTEIKIFAILKWMALTKDELAELVKIGLPHDFYSTVEYLGEITEELNVHFNALSPYTENVRPFSRLTSIRSELRKIDKRFEKFWERNEDSVDSNDLQEKFEAACFPHLKKIEQLASELERILIYRVTVKENDTFAKKAMTNALNQVSIIIYYSKRARYYIVGMIQLINFEDQAATEVTNLNTFFERQALLLKDINSNDIEISVLNKLPTICMDNSHAHTCFANILRNAIKYRKKNECRISIFFDDGSNLPEKFKANLKENLYYLDENSNFISINILDYGIGIQKRFWNSIFEPYQQVHSKVEQAEFELKELSTDSLLDYSGVLQKSDKYSGMGIGLALVKLAAELYGGRVTVNSDFGSWTCFTIELPNEVVV